MLTQLTQYSLIKNRQLVKFTSPFKSVSYLLDFYAKKFPDKEALVYLEDNKKTIFSYKQLKEIVGKTSSYLIKKLNMRKNERIVFLMKNSPEILFLNLASWSSSIITVPLDSKRDSLESILYKIKQTKSKALFIKTDTTDENAEAELNRVIKNVRANSKIKVIKFSSLKDFVKLIEKETPIYLNSPIKNDALILYTSGTTAFPRGALLRVESLISNADSIADWLNIKENERFMTILPLHHINSTTFVLATLLKGGTIILTPGYSNSGFFPTLAETEATITSIVPTICHDQLSQEEIFNKIRHKLKVSRIQIGSAPVQPLEAEEFVRKFQIPLIQGYGQTETSLRSTGMPYKVKENEILNSKYFELLRSNTIGTEMKWTNVTTLKDGKEARENEIGEICIRGPGIMKEYIKELEETKKSFKFGWFHSGDLGYYKIINSEKFFFLTGRIKEIIIKGGINISPLAVELALKRAYHEIDQVYVIGYEDKRFGEEIGAVIVFKDNVSKEKRKEIIKSITNNWKNTKIKNLSIYESPRKVVEISSSELPMTSTGKVQRTKIKEMFPKLTSLGNIKEIKGVIAKNHSFIFRQIFPYEREVIKKAVEINNKRWYPLTSTEKEFRIRSKNGFLIGALNFNNNLLGTVSALRANNIEALKKTKWDRLTDKGTLSTNNPDGKALVCVAISTLRKENKSDNHKSRKKKVNNILLKKLADKYLDDYLKSNIDPIVRFHKKPKGGLKKGAKLISVIKGGRNKDKDALGYSILFAYPEINNARILFSENSSVGTQLIEAVLMFSQQLGIKHVFAFSRPAGLRKYLEEKLP